MSGPHAGALALVIAALLTALPGAAAQNGDSDGDGMPNAWEQRHRLDPNNPRDAARDPDRDELTNVLEYQRRGDPRNPDTDADGLTDGDEVNQWQSLVDVRTQIVGRVQVSGRCPRRNDCELRHLFSVEVSVRNHRGKTIERTKTLVNGRFAFEGLRAGRYRIEAFAVAGTLAPAPLETLVYRNQAGPTTASFTFADGNRRGVVGQATQAPTCGGPQREGEDCVAPLSGATISVREGDENGPVVASTTTGSNGYYAFRLDPGNYTLVAERYGDSDLPSPPAPVSFTVFDEDDGPNLIDSDYDTGIR
jgi:carboxypeptidase family protein/thrombospondin type 3 repeat protein